MSVAGMMSAGGTLYSPRIWRTAAMTSRRRSNSPALSSGGAPARGHDACATNAPAGRPGNFCQSASVMNGTIGCSRRSAWSNTCSSTLRATSPSAPSLCRRGLTASTYQSASSFHANRRAVSAYASSRSPRKRSAAGHLPPAGRGAPNAASHSAIAASSRPRIHASADVNDFASICSNFGGTRSPMFCSRNRPMFHNFVTKFRPGANDCSRSFGSSTTSEPMPRPEITVHRNASAPYRLITSSGSIPLPSDFDILRCCVSRTVPCK